jgi:tetratricopeptide (TPR) repeat protein
MKDKKDNPDYWEMVEKLINETIGTGNVVSLQRWNDSNSIQADIDISSNLLNGTPHEVKENVELIHYTTINSLFEIINSKKLRLGNASQMNDPQELSFFLKKFKEFISPEFYEQANNMFLISFCEYNSKAENNNEHFNMWRNYGDNGNGVGIVFKLANYDLRNSWIDSAVGKVDYNPKSLGYEGLKKYFESLQEMKKLDKFSINNLPKIIFQLATLHKAAIWKEENEIRLFRFLKWDKLEWAYNFNNADFTKEIKSTFNDRSIKYFIELDLDNKIKLEEAKEVSQQANKLNPTMNVTKEDVFDIYPALSIEKIIFGYKIPNELKHQILNSVNKLAFQNLGINLKFEDSHFTDYFKQ